VESTKLERLVRASLDASFVRAKRWPHQSDSSLLTVVQSSDEVSDHTGYRSRKAKAGAA
jgi:hypothetical protein